MRGARRSVQGIKIDDPIFVNAHKCYTVKTHESHAAGLASGPPGRNQGHTPKYVHSKEEAPHAQQRRSVL